MRTDSSVGQTEGGDRVCVVLLPDGTTPTLRAMRSLSAQVPHRSLQVVALVIGAAQRRQQAIQTFRPMRDALSLAVRHGSRAQCANIGAAAADADFLIFLDPGLEFDDTFVERMFYVSRGFAPAVVAARANGLSSPPLLSRCRGALGVHRELFEALGGFAEDVPLEAQLTDFCWRAQLSGYTVAEGPSGVSTMRNLRRGWHFLDATRDRWGLVRLGAKYRSFGVNRIARRLDQLPSNQDGRPVSGLSMSSASNSDAIAWPLRPGSSSRAATPVLLLHWRAPRWCAASVASFLTSSQEVQITVVNNSPECAAELREQVPPPSVVIEVGGNLGYAGAANVGLTHWLAGDEPYVIVAAHDCHVASDTVELLRRAAARFDEYGVLGPILTDKPRGGTNTISGGASESILPGSVVDVDWLSGTCLLLTRRCIEEIGLFDASLGSYHEDVELCWRARASGWKVGLVSGATAHGLGSISPKADQLMRTNWIRLARSDLGARAAARAYRRVAASALRNLVGALAPSRTTAQRLASRSSAKSAVPVLLRVWDVLLPRSPAIQPPRLRGSYSPRASTSVTGRASAC